MSTYKFVIGAAVLGSVCLHAFVFGGLQLIEMPPPRKEDVQVRVKVTEKVALDPTPVPPPPKPREAPPQKKLPETRRPNKEPVKAAKKVQGLTEDSLVKDSSVTAPVGNTLMQKDEGKRLTPAEIESLERDLSADAILIQGSFISPEYTQAALDAYMEGRFVVDVYIDSEGKVIEAELRKSIGYGMDDRVIDVAKSARFTPRRDAKGVPLPGWTEIAFYLEIP